ncbi:Gpi1-domain-containing protein [Hesseltinella vesiculosa]|uniref:Gpi1-domain-containing protein n=1 Tax=Hesseltinella vesiculosa TaxID=101127 RepID=A0A1X2GTN6_9FUNG|nr:Gpi1-domain-containing protein [Hesseltinella vesiculosa]
MSDINLSDMTRLIDQFCTNDKDTNFKLIHHVCNDAPTILGQFVHGSECTRPPPDRPYWLTLELDDQYLPMPRSLVAHGKPTSLSSFQIILFEQPNPDRLQFLALEPLALDITVKDKHKGEEDIVAQQIDRQQQLTLQNEAAIIHNGRELLWLQQDDSTSVLKPVLAEINSSYYLEHGIGDMQREMEMRQQRSGISRRSLWEACIQGCRLVHAWVVDGMIVVPLQYLLHNAKKLVLGPWLFLAFLLFALVEMSLYLLALRIPKLNVSLKDISAAGQQIDLRFQQLYFWPRQYVKLRRRNWANTAQARAYYINFYNSMWLVANDIIIGMAIGSYLMGNCEYVSRTLHALLKTYTVDSLSSMMYWFLETPAGLKLNIELGRFLSELFLWLIHLWMECMTYMEPWTPKILYFIGCSGVFGISMVIALLSDMLAVLTMQLYCFYMVAARIFNWQLVTLYALFNLFRGKKRNMLRNRIDSCDYDLDQLLLGTCLFTLLTFLFPTVFLYYLTFALGRICVIFLQAIMETLLAFFNHFPLFAIMLRIKDPDRVPGGLQFDIFEPNTFLFKHHWFRQTWRHWTSRHSRSSRRVRFNLPNETPARPRGAYLWIRNTPIPFGAIFFQYMLLWKRLSAHYFSNYVFRCFLYGEPIKPSPKLQYSMLPDTR